MNNKKLLSIFLAFLFWGNSATAAIDIIGLWEQSGTSKAYTFRPLDSDNGIVMIAIIGDYQDLYSGTISDNDLQVCTIASEPFEACYSGKINSTASITLSLSSCQNKSIDICSLLSTSEQLNREINFEISGIYQVSNGKYFMIHDSAGTITAYELDVANGMADGFTGSRARNKGSVASKDGSGISLDFLILSDSQITATVTDCVNAPANEYNEDPVGTVFTLKKVVN